MLVRDEIGPNCLEGWAEADPSPIPQAKRNTGLPHFRKCQAASLVKAAVVAGTISIGYPQAVALQIVGITAMPC